MSRRLLTLALLALAGCTPAFEEAVHNVILPEQRSVEYRDPAQLPPVPIPPSVPPRTVSDRRPDARVWQLSLDDAVRIGLENAKVIRVLAGVTAVSSGQTIYDPAISNTLIDQAQARFDPVFFSRNNWSHTDEPSATPDFLNPTRSLIVGTQADAYQGQVGVSKTNVLGGTWALTLSENPTRIDATGLPLNPQNRSALELSYTQPLLQGAGFPANTAPIVIARLDTERSYFQYKDSVQELVRSIIEAYWNLVQGRVDVFARNIQVQQSQEAYEREQARMKTGFGDLGTVAQARVTYNQFRASLIAAEANVLVREQAIRNLLGLPPDDDCKIVPVSAPTDRRLRPKWCELVQLAEQRRPDVVELKLIVEADQQRRIQAANQALPRLDATALYRWNGLEGTMPNGEHLSSGPGQFTDWSVGLNFSVPLGLRQGRAAVRQTELLILRDRANVEQAVHAAIHDIAITVRNLDSAYEQYLAYKETRAAAYENLKVQIEQFRVGRTIYLNVLQALNDFGNSVSSEAQALVSYNVALATLERQTGTILETHGLVFQEERFRAAGPLVVRDRLYPSAIVPVGAPQRYPGTGEPSENSFDLRSPDVREKPTPPPATLPPPRPVP